MIRKILVSLCLILVMASPAAAHKIKVFAAVEGDTISGYAFFVGGGRAQNTDWTAKDATGQVLGTGQTGTDGTFSLSVTEPVTSDITITVDTHEGHIASKTLQAARFGVASDAAAPAQPASDISASADPAVPSHPVETSRVETTALVEAAVQRQIEPLLERIEEMDSRLRYTDILSGIFLIIGLAGMGMWARARFGAPKPK